MCVTVVRCIYFFKQLIYIYMYTYIYIYIYTYMNLPGAGPIFPERALEDRPRRQGAGLGFTII